MDPTTYGAATAALFSAEDDARRWFQLVAEQVEALAEDASFGDAEAAVHQAAETAGLAWAAEALSDYLQAEAQDPVAVLRDLADPGQEAEYVEANLAAAAYAQDSAQDSAQEAAGPDEPGTPAAEPGQAADQQLDEAAWAEYLARWQGGWDGTEESWPAFTESFLYHAPEGLRGAAEQLVLSAEASDKVATLTPYGIPAVAHPAAAPDAGEVIAAVLQDRPELGELGGERLQELFAEVAAELAAERQAANQGGER